MRYDERLRRYRKRGWVDNDGELTEAGEREAEERYNSELRDPPDPWPMDIAPDPYPGGSLI